MDGSVTLEKEGFRPTATGLQVFGSPSYEAWSEYGDRLLAVEGAIQWLIGDWLNYGEHRWGEMYSQAVDDSQAKTWRNYKFVAGAIKPERRRVELSYSHHAEVASLGESHGDRLLNMAIGEGWSCAELRKQANQHKLEAGEIEYEFSWAKSDVVKQVEEALETLENHLGVLRSTDVDRTSALYFYSMAIKRLQNLVIEHVNVPTSGQSEEE